MVEEDTDDLKTATKKGGSEILSGLSKARDILKQHIGEGLQASQDATKGIDDETEKAIIASSEMGKAIVKGVKKGASASLFSIISGASKIAKAVENSLEDKPKRGNSDDDYELIE